MRTEQQSQVLSLALARLSRSTTLATLRFSATSSNKPTGIHSIDAASHDLAGHLFLCAEEVNPDHREGLFRECWNLVREHLSWNKRSNNSDISLCQYLDKRSLSWHVSILTQIANNLPFEKPSLGRIVNEACLEEYV